MQNCRSPATHQPFPVTLETFLVELLDSNDHPGAGPGRREGVLVDPPLEDRPETTFAKHTVRPEVPGGRLELVEGEAPDIS